jgi:hypothetical protein
VLKVDSCEFPDVASDYMTRSERLTIERLELLDLDPRVRRAQVEAESKCEVHRHGPKSCRTASLDVTILFESGSRQTFLGGDCGRFARLRCFKCPKVHCALWSFQWTIYVCTDAAQSVIWGKTPPQVSQSHSM